MTKISIPNQHPFLNSFVPINEICQPLFSNTEISFFSYSRRYQDNSLLLFETYPEWSDYYLPKGLVMPYNKISFLASKYSHPDNKSFSFLLGDEEPDFYIEGKDFGLESPLFLVNKIADDDCYEVICYASRYKKNLVNFYLNNFDALRKFRLFFLEKASKLIKDGGQNKLHIFSVQQKNNTEKTVSDYSLNAPTKDFICKRYPITINKKQSYLTQRELECLSLLAKGKTIKRTASLMCVSPRTIETLQNNMKERTELYSREQLIEMFFQNDLANIM